MQIPWNKLNKARNAQSQASLEERIVTFILSHFKLRDRLKAMREAARETTGEPSVLLANLPEFCSEIPMPLLARRLFKVDWKQFLAVDLIGHFPKTQLCRVYEDGLEEFGGDDYGLVVPCQPVRYLIVHNQSSLAGTSRYMFQLEHMATPIIVEPLASFLTNWPREDGEEYLPEDGDELE